MYDRISPCSPWQLAHETRRGKMGAALSSRAEWTSASETGRKLDFSRANESLLREIVEYVEKLCKENPREAEVLFKRPLVWKSPLKLSDLQTLSPPDYTPRSVNN